MLFGLGMRFWRVRIANGGYRHLKLFHTRTKSCCKGGTDEGLKRKKCSLFAVFGRFASSLVPFQTFSPNMKYVVSVGNQHDMAVNVWNWKTRTKLASGKVATKVRILFNFIETSSSVTWWKIANADQRQVAWAVMQFPGSSSRIYLPHSVSIGLQPGIRRRQQLVCNSWKQTR